MVHSCVRVLKKHMIHLTFTLLFRFSLLNLKRAGERQQCPCLSPLSALFFQFTSAEECLLSNGCLTTADFKMDHLQN